MKQMLPVSRRALPLAALILISTAALPAQPPPRIGMPVLRNYAQKEYKGAPQIWTMVQDRRGVLYFGNSSTSILEYDGVSWRTIHTGSSITRSLVLDAAGTIWAGGAGQIGYLAPDATGSLHYVSILDKIPQEHRAFSDVWQILVTPQGNFFRSYERLFRWDGKRMQVWKTATRFEALSEVRGRLYTSQGGIGLQEIVGDELRPVPGGEAYKNSAKLFLYPWDERNMVVSARDQMLTLFDGEKSTPFRTGADEFLRAGGMYTSLPLGDGSLCVTTLRGGSVVIGHDGQQRRIIDQDAGLLSNNVLSAYRDRDGALWLGQGIGISRVEINSPISVFTRSAVDATETHRGELYGVTTTAGSSLFRVVANSKTGLPSVHPIPTTISQAFELLSFHDPGGKNSDQLLVAGTGGVYRVEGDTVSFVNQSSGAGARGAQTILQSRKAPNRVFAGNPQGVFAMRWEGGRWMGEGQIESLGRNDSLAEDETGALWAGSANGVLRITFGANGLNGARVETFSGNAGLPRGDYWVGLVAGNIIAFMSPTRNFYRWDKASNKFVADNQFLLAPKDAEAASRLFELSNGDIWSTTLSAGDQRVGIFHRQPGGTWQLDEDTPRQLSRSPIDRVRADAEGILWVNGVEGLVRFDPRVKAARQSPFTALVRRVTAGREDIFGGLAREGVPATRLPHEKNALHLEFAAPVYGYEDDTVYQHMLEGADRDWSDWLRQRDVSYSGLGPGSYRFRVRARSLDGRVSEEGVYSLTLLPPWYRTNLSYALYGVLFLLTGFGARRRVITREREKSRQETEALEATVADRTQEIRTQAGEIAAQKDHLQQAYETVELLSDIGREITASLDLETILFKLYERVNQLVDAGIFGVGLYRPDKNLIEYTLAIENGKRYAPYTRDTLDKNQLAVWCIDNRKPVLLNDVNNDFHKYINSYQHGQRVLEDGTSARPPASMMYLPLIAQDRVLGVLTIQSFRKNAYTEQHLSLLQNLAAYTTIALDNAGAYALVNQREQEVRERAAELATINRITQALSAQLDLNGIIQLVGDQARAVFHAPIAYVALLDEASMMIHFPYAFGEEAQSRPFGEGLTSQIIRTGQPLLINTDLDASREKLGVKQLGRRAASYLGVPIPAGGETIGVISVQTTEQEGRFTEADQRLLSTIAAAVGVAVHNARLFDETRHARAVAEEADAAKSSFLSTVSHELRTPLTSVLGFAKIIRRRLEDRLFPLIPEDDRKIAQTKRQVVENLDVVVSEGERLTKLIDDVLDLAKIEAGKFTWNMESVSLGDVIERAGAATASLLDAKKLNFVRDLEPGLPPVTGDHDRLIQVVINLISNAVKFTDAGSITCRARHIGGAVEVQVIDTGIGIAAADQPRVFEKFKQVGDTLTDKPKGTGLGLPICREIVEYHGGQISVESEPGKGSIFTFTIPVQPGGVVAATPAPLMNIEALVRQLREKIATQQPRAQSILVVDDDPNIRSLLQQEFTEAGYTVRLAENGRHALQLIRDEKPGLVVLDVMMPEMNGFDVAAVLKNDPATMDIPIIILSIVEDKERGFRLGVDRYLTKPIDTESLFREVGALLDQGKSKKKVMVVDEDASAVRTLTDVLRTGGYHVVESNGAELVAKAMSSRPDIIILNSLLSSQQDVVRSLRFEKGLENVLFLIYQ